MSKLTRYTLVALGAIALSVTSYCIGNATAQEPSPTEQRNEIRTVELAPMPALGADTAVLATFTERARWDEALRWRALADVGSGTSEAVGASNAGHSGATNAAVGGATPQPGPAPSGDCSGYPSYVPTWRESNNQPDVVNRSSGAFGCAQLMPMHFAPGGTCADLDTSYEGQRECAWRLPQSAWNG